MTPWPPMAGLGKRAVRIFANATFPNGEKTLSCNASTCSCAIRDNITWFDGLIHACEKAQAEFPDLFLSIGENRAGSGDIGVSSPIGGGMGPFPAEEHGNWQKQ